MRPQYIFKSVPSEQVPYLPTSKEYVILDNGKNPLVSRIIMDNIVDIEDFLAKRDRRLFYMPRFLEKLKNSTFFSYPNIVAYNSPANSEFDITGNNLLSWDDLYGMYGFSKEDCPYDCILVEAYSRTNDGSKFNFRLYPILAKDYNEFENWLYYVSIDDEDHIMFRIVDNNPHETADDNFEADIIKLGMEIRDRVKQLKAIGLTEYAIKRLVNSFDKPKSRVYVDDNFRIFLPEFNNLEIILTPAVKTVYFLFLLYPEGIYFKDLILHKDELEKIYALVNRFENKDKVKEVVGHLIDPMDNSINEKCARIKNAFVSAFRDDIAEDYYIDGARGCKKGVGDIEIVLPDELLRIKQKLR